MKKDAQHDYVGVQTDLNLPILHMPYGTFLYNIYYMEAM